MGDGKDKLKRAHRSTLYHGYFRVPERFIHLLWHCAKGDTVLTADDITPLDLESAVAYRSRSNDVSFITKDNRIIILVEHQSTLNPNMALRLFIYYMELLQIWIKMNDINMYGTKKIVDLPVPEMYVAYNGTAELEEETSTFTLTHPGINIEVKVKVVNIRYEKLTDTSPCNALAGYAYFYKVYDEGKAAGMTGEAAFTKAREECITRGYMKGFIEKEEFIVDYKDIFFDYDTQLIYQGRAEGRAEGEAEGFEKAISIAIESNAPDSVVEIMAKKANIPPQRLAELRALATA